jgi:hypothetical protein
MFNKFSKYYLAAVIFALVIGLYVFSTIHRHGKYFASGQQENDSEPQHRTFGKTQFKTSFKRFSGAETLRNTRSPELIAEVEKILAQKGLPADVFTDDIPQATNIAQTLHTNFHEYYGIVDGKSPNELSPNDMRKLWGASPIDVWDVNKTAVEGVNDILAKIDVKRIAVRGMLEQPNTCFYYIFNRPEKSWRMLTDTDASKYIADYALLEEYLVAKSLLEGNIEDALEALAYIFRMTELASALEVVGVRQDAALVRLRTFNVMQRVVLDPKFDKAHMIFLRDMLSEQHENWTPEKVTWFGDRASGIKLYNDVLMHGPGEALEPEEISHLERRGVYLKFVKGFLKNYAADEVFYLRSMQNIIDISKKPYCERLKVLNSMNKALLAEEDTENEPFVANIQLKQIDAFMRVFALDQSALERALVAALISLGQTDTGNYTDPFTGVPYESKRVNGLISISTKNLKHPFRVPDFTKK